MDHVPTFKVIGRFRVNDLTSLHSYTGNMTIHATKYMEFSDFNLCPLLP
jgi:hypothetical protein